MGELKTLSNNKFEELDLLMVENMQRQQSGPTLTGISTNRRFI